MTPRVVMDWPQAWEFVRGTQPEDHHERCSWRTQNGALLCDCHILNDEYNRRAAVEPPEEQRVPNTHAESAWDTQAKSHLAAGEYLLANRASDVADAIRFYWLAVEPPEEQP